MPVRYEVRNRIGVITLDRPEAMNALDPSMLFGLAEAWDSAEDDDDVWVVVITGIGDKAFCVGADLKVTIPAATGEAREGSLDAPGSSGSSADRFPNMTRTLLRGRFYPKPVIAAVNGHCIAGGLELLLACDLRYASENATFALQEVKWGLFPLAGSTVRLPRQIPYCRAMELLLIGDRVSARTALEMGLVNEVCGGGPGAALDRAMQVAERLTENGPFAVRKIKESVVRGLGLSMDQAFAEELRLGAEVFASQDAVEGPAAFAEKRAPKFTGR